MRIAIVNDLLMAVESLRRIILSVPGHEIAWVAGDGEDAVRKAARDAPDLILMDLFMPNMDGVEATRRIMQESPCPILIVTATVGENTAKVFEAMGSGALDAVNVPMAGSGDDALRSRYILLRKIHMIAKLKGLGPGRKQAGGAHFGDHAPRLAAVGSSTGGPKALSEILSRLPAELEAVIVIVQHVDEKFSAGLVSWLDAQSPLKVQLALEGDAPRPSNVYVAGTNDHLIVTSDLRFSYTPEPGNSAYRPSVDVFFNSLARNWPESGLAILLTGMGRDGAKGLAELHDRGWETIAQDKHSSVVYGMPKAAIEMGAVSRVLPIQDMAGAITDFSRNRRGTARPAKDPSDRPDARTAS